MSEPLNDQILSEASAWFVEYRSGTLSPSAQDAFMIWLRRSPEHIRAYLEVSRTYVELPAAAEVPSAQFERLLAKLEARETDGVIALDEWSPRATPTQSLPPMGVSVGRRIALAASLLLVLGAVAGAYLVSVRGLYATGPGESRTVTLEDASRVELNARTRLRVRYTPQAREVELLEGQALFQVAKDRSRPFLVRSGSALVRAVGTEFDVYRRGLETTVTVLEGTVAIGPPPAPSTDPRATPAATDLLVAAGEQAVVTPQGSRKPHAANVSAATAWTRGQLEFQETPLSEVADEFNRSSSRTFVLTSPALATVRISGVYSSVDPSAFILFLKSQPDLIVTETGTVIQVRAKGP